MCVEAAARRGNRAHYGAGDHKHDRHHSLMAIPEAWSVSPLLFHLVSRQLFPGDRIQAVIIECVGECFPSRDGDQCIEGHRSVTGIRSTQCPR